MKNKITEIIQKQTTPRLFSKLTKYCYFLRWTKITIANRNSKTQYARYPKCVTEIPKSITSTADTGTVKQKR